MKIRKISIMLAVSLSVLACKSIPIAENVTTMDVSFKWSSKSGCSRVSPEIHIGGIPTGTQYLKVKMTDLNLKSYRHGGGEVIYNGSGIIPEGALKSYEGPCPPNPHNYEFLVQALNGEKSLILGVGKKARTYPE